MTVGDLLRRADSRELAEWRAFKMIEKKNHQTSELERRAIENSNKAKHDLKRKRGL